MSFRIFNAHFAQTLEESFRYCWKGEVPDLKLKVCPEAVSQNLYSLEVLKIGSPWICAEFVAFLYFK